MDASLKHAAALMWAASACVFGWAGAWPWCVAALVVFAVADKVSIGPRHQPYTTLNPGTC
jgi:hypothetical protein